MRDGIDQEWTDALAARGLKTALMAFFDTKSEPLYIWTGVDSIIPTGSGDVYLDGHQFEPLAQGIPVTFSDNAFSYEGSDEFTVTLAVPATIPDELIAASLDSDEYKGRTGVIWRALMVQPPSSTTPALWAFRRIRSGKMDKMSIVMDSTVRAITLTIEAHASMISNASGSTYLDQPIYDPYDTSQAYAVSVANNPKGPTK